jgi:hypothetical protein
MSRAGHLEYVEIAPMPGKQADSNRSDDRHCPLMQLGGTILVDIVFLIVQRYVGTWVSREEPANGRYQGAGS